VGKEKERKEVVLISLLVVAVLTYSANRIMYHATCVEKSAYYSGGTLLGYTFYLKLIRGNNMAGDKDLTVGTFSFVDVIVSW
jgi:hypothetical protein